jgi:putative ABC transport system permease protein
VTLRDAVAGAVANLWRMKLRSTLTITGVVIAIAAFSSMMSLGLGMQRKATEQFEALGLLSTLQVYPRTPAPGEPPDSARVLDDDAIGRIAQVPGVRLAYPFDDFPVTVTLVDSTRTSTAQALPRAALETKLFSTLVAGAPFDADSAGQVLVSVELAGDLGVADPAGLVGRRLAVETRVASFDSALFRAFTGTRRLVAVRVREGWSDSLLTGLYWRDFGRELAAGALTGFMDGLLNARRTVRDTLEVSGVLEGRRRGHARTAALLIPTAVAARLSSGDISDDPSDLLAMLRTGAIPGIGAERRGAGYARVTVDVDPAAPYEPVRDAVRAMGFRTFSYADEFESMRRFFLVFRFGVGLIGGIALLMASLGIVNTMVMSILERTREIGILKALGADDGDIRRIFLVESALIGLVGAIFGVGLGRVVTLAAGVVADRMIEDVGFPVSEVFVFSPGLILGALAFGTVVSLLAGLYPAARAARIDPIQALRHD